MVLSTMLEIHEIKKMTVLVAFVFGVIVVAKVIPQVSAIPDEPIVDNPSIADFDHESCQQETLSGPNFNQFYNIHEFTNAEGVVEIFVKFMGVSDGHVILTETANDKDPLYMIVIGSYEGSLSEIRRSKWGEDVFKMNTPGILSEQQFRGFLIRYNRKKGELWVYSEGSDMPLLHWKDPQPLYIEYFSFAAYDGKVVQVAFNCKPKDEYSVISPVNPRSTPNPKRRQAMLKGYDVLALPNFKLDRDPNVSLVTVSLPSLTLTHFSIDEEKQTFELEAWPYFTWHDDRLTWEPEANEPGDGKIHFSPDEIFIPDVVLYNSAQPTVLNVYGKTQCIVTRDGTVNWVPPSKFVVYCDLNLRRWPKDTQVCTVKLGSWTHDASEIDMQFGTVEGQDEKVKTLEDFKKEDMEWELMETKALRESKQYECCPESYTSITYEFTIQRRSTLYTYTVFLPVILVSFVNLILFLQPADSSGRVMVAAVNFLVISVFLIFFRTRLPEVDHVPYIVILYGWNLILVALSILTAALVSNLSLIIGSSSPPTILRSVYNPTLMSVLCLGNLTSQNKSGRMQPTASAKSSYIKRATDEIETASDGRIGKDAKLSEWALLAATVDRLSFVAYTTITLILLACLC